MDVQQEKHHESPLPLEIVLRPRQCVHRSDRRPRRRAGLAHRARCAARRRRSADHVRLRLVAARHARDRPDRCRCGHRHQPRGVLAPAFAQILRHTQRRRHHGENCGHVEITAGHRPRNRVPDPCRDRDQQAFGHRRHLTHRPDAVPRASRPSPPPRKRGLFHFSKTFSPSESISILPMVSVRNVSILSALNVANVSLWGCPYLLSFPTDITVKVG